MTDLKRAADLLRGIELVHADIADLGERGRVPVVGVERRGRVGNHVLIGGRLSYVLRERGAFLLGTLHRKALVAGALESLNLRSEEHTSELQSLMRISYAVFCLKKKKTQNNTIHTRQYEKKNNYHHHITHR